MKNIHCPCNLFAGLLTLHIGVFLIILLVSLPSKKKGICIFLWQVKCFSCQLICKCCKPCFDGIHYRTDDPEYGRLGMWIHIEEHWETDVEVLVFYHLCSHLCLHFYEDGSRVKLEQTAALAALLSCLCSFQVNSR